MAGRRGSTKRQKTAKMRGHLLPDNNTNRTLVTIAMVVILIMAARVITHDSGNSSNNHNISRWNGNGNHTHNGRKKATEKTLITMGIDS